jgi:hypothetical protein
LIAGEDLIKLAIGNWKSAIARSLFYLVHVWQGLFGGRPLWRVIKQDRHFLQSIQVGARLDQYLMSLRGGASLDLDNFTNIQTRGINTVLAGG